MLHDGCHCTQSASRSFFHRSSSSSAVVAECENASQLHLPPVVVGSPAGSSHGSHWPHAPSSSSPGRVSASILSFRPSERRGEVGCNNGNSSSRGLPWVEMACPPVPAADHRTVRDHPLLERLHSLNNNNNNNNNGGVGASSSLLAHNSVPDSVLSRMECENGAQKKGREDTRGEDEMLYLTSDWLMQVEDGGPPWGEVTEEEGSENEIIIVMNTTNHHQTDGGRKPIRAKATPSTSSHSPCTSPSRVFLSPLMPFHEEVSGYSEVSPKPDTQVFVMSNPLAEDSWSPSFGYLLCYGVMSLLVMLMVKVLFAEFHFLSDIFLTFVQQIAMICILVLTESSLMQRYCSTSSSIFHSFGAFEAVWHRITHGSTLKRGVRTEIVENECLHGGSKEYSVSCKSNKIQGTPPAIQSRRIFSLLYLYVWQLGPFAFVSALTIMTGQAAMKGLDMPSFFGFRGFSTLLILLGEHFWLRQPWKVYKVVSVAVLLCGALILLFLTGKSDDGKTSQWRSSGFLYIMLNNALSAAQTLLLRNRMDQLSHIISVNNILLFNAVVLAFLSAILLISNINGDLEILYSFQYSISFILCLLFFIFSGCASTYLFFECTKRTSPLSVTMAGTMRNVITSFAGMCFSDYTFSGMSLVGLLVSASGTLLYACDDFFFDWLTYRRWLIVPCFSLFVRIRKSFFCKLRKKM